MKHFPQCNFTASLSFPTQFFSLFVSRCPLRRDSENMNIYEVVGKVDENRARTLRTMAERLFRAHFQRNFHPPPAPLWARRVWWTVKSERRAARKVRPNSFHLCSQRARRGLLAVCSYLSAMVGPADNLFSCAHSVRSARGRKRAGERRRFIHSRAHLTRLMTVNVTISFRPSSRPSSAFPSLALFIPARASPWFGAFFSSARFPFFTAFFSVCPLVLRFAYVPARPRERVPHRAFVRAVIVIVALKFDSIRLMLSDVQFFFVHRSRLSDDARHKNTRRKWHRGKGRHGNASHQRVFLVCVLDEIISIEQR